MRSDAPGSILPALWSRFPLTNKVSRGGITLSQEGFVFCSRLSYLIVWGGEIKKESTKQKLFELFFGLLINDLTCHVVTLQSDGHVI